jgi:DNA processing protein
MLPRHHSPTMPRPTSRYAKPSDIKQIRVHQLVGSRRTLPVRLHSASAWCVGDIGLLQGPAVAIVGTRKASGLGCELAFALAAELASQGVAIVSGLAAGIDSAAHWGAIRSGGRTVAVIGTPVDRVYPAENAELQEIVAEEHLLVSPFELGSPTYKASFPERNRLMAAVSDATLIVEAGETSGTVHQAAECIRLGRPLLLHRRLVEGTEAAWVQSFGAQPGTMIVDTAADVLAVLSPHRGAEGHHTS